MEYFCGICSEKVKNFISCSSSHNFHEKCVKNLMFNSFFIVLNNCENCILELPLKITKSSGVCIFCKGKQFSNECKYWKKVCRSCTMNFNCWKHYLDCDVCSKKFCSECNKEINLKIYSREDKCEQHNLCINHLISKQDCEKCDNFINKADLNCKICCDLVKKNNIHCDSGHFYCDACIEHFGFTSASCRDCYKLFNLDSEYERAKLINSNLRKSYFLDRVGHLRCYRCSKSSEFRTYQHSLCNRCYFCPICINSCFSSDTHIDPECKFYFTELKKFASQVIICQICKLPPDGSSKFCEKAHYLCLDCRKLLISADKIAFKRILNCSFCVKELRALREYAKVYEPGFDRAIIKVPAYPMTCGHILKFDEYRIRITSQVLSFIQHLKSANIKKLNKGLSIYCDRKHCRTKIVFDFDSIQPILQTYLPSDFHQYLQTIQAVFTTSHFYFVQQENQLNLINREETSL